MKEEPLTVESAFIGAHLRFSIVVELKAVSQLLPEHGAQIINYLRITKQALDYLINFGKAGGLDFKRIILSEFLPQ